MSLRLIVMAALLCLSAGQVEARQRWWGYCGQGGQKIFTTGQQSTTYALATYPSCTVTVYLAGTVTLASIFSDNSGTVKANPFTADTKAFVFFYASQGRYDVRYSGGGLASPTTISDVYLNDAGGPVGPTGPAGPPGADGPTGPNGTGAAPYKSPAFTAINSLVVPPATHTQGINPFAACFDDSTPAIEVACAKSYAVDGTVTFTFDPAFSGFVRIIGGGTGASGSNTSNTGSLINTDYNFSKTVGAGVTGNLSVNGSNTVTFATCPLGVSGTDANHYYRISGGTGTAEQVLGTGGTCATGVSNGTLIFTSVNPHIGSWLIASATSGIQEAVNVAESQVTASARPSTTLVEIASGDWPIYAPVDMTIPVGIHGQGVTSSIISLQVDGLNGFNVTTFGYYWWEMSDVRVRYKDGLSGYMTSGVMVNINGPNTGNIRNVQIDASFIGVQGASVQYIIFEAVQIQASSKGIYLIGAPSNPSSFYGTNITLFGTDANSRGLHVLNSIAGFFLSNFNLFGSSFYFDSGTAQPLNEIYLANGIVDYGNTVSATCLTVVQDPALPTNVMFLANTRLNCPGVNSVAASFTGKSAVTITSANIIGGSVGLALSNTTGVNITGSSITASSTGNALQLQSAANNNLFIGNTIGFNESGSAVQALNAIYTDTSSNDTNLFFGNRFGGALSTTWNGTGNRFDPNQAGLPIPAIASSATLNLSPFPLVTITGTTGVTAISGLTAGRTGKFITTSGAVLFTAGATIGNTFTTTANVPVDWFFDGTKIYLH